MDWSKSKSILIVVLLVFCCALGGRLASTKIEEKMEAKSANRAAEEYLLSLGVSLECDIPTKRPSMEVIFVEYSEEASEKELSYKKYPVYTNEGTSASYTFSSAGESKAKVISASSALIDAVTRSKEEKQVVYEIELCYYINNNKSVTNGSMDTAVPAWRVSTGEGNTYILAY